ncbi:16S rRNA (guanine(966)-N(2))-methyltransferase RsmD [Palleronia caenipelagi]|uniref:16S rRNA (Guanine(966)-N(2))-methyltransferase RsmD n=1 Tax=Palleronia caenipelagi TaxID=2489174 RepID=A0A547Q6K3_9RHOB|nr:16S rRNA (guanine(966)-N(2))-methyltransferase RsmD [Palleronia caenipelagi]TRD21994.1 16S rRNA (guanine(966)-N(2))-methyltransferase RsmD [Palleronia caenipelagi]
MRIIGGSHGGRVLASVGKGDPGAHLRPTTDRVRESLFSALEGGRFGDPIEGARVLDLFAGTGALGLEALSRGAAHVTFVENGRVALGLLGRNIASLGEAARTRVVKSNATRLREASAAAALVFLDPPYGKGLGAPALTAALAGGWIAPGALIVWEDASEAALPHGLSRLDARRYGDTWITFARHGDGD